jgi:hypothetical protein
MHFTLTIAQRRQIDPQAGQRLEDVVQVDDVVHVGDVELRIVEDDPFDPDNDQFALEVTTPTRTEDYRIGGLTMPVTTLGSRETVDVGTWEQMTKRLRDEVTRLLVESIEIERYIEVSQ